MEKLILNNSTLISSDGSIQKSHIKCWNKSMKGKYILIIDKYSKCIGIILSKYKYKEIESLNDLCWDVNDNRIRIFHNIDYYTDVNPTNYYLISEEEYVGLKL